MSHKEWGHQAGTPLDLRAGDWHTLTLDSEGHITSGDQDMAQLLGPQAHALSGKLVTTVIADLPFSEKTPGYNLAYAIFHGANGQKVRRKAQVANGKSIPVDTVLSSRRVKGHRSITLSFREASA